MRTTTGRPRPHTCHFCTRVRLLLTAHASSVANGNSNARKKQKALRDQHGFSAPLSPLLSPSSPLRWPLLLRARHRPAALPALQPQSSPEWTLASACGLPGVGRWNARRREECGSGRRKRLLEWSHRRQACTKPFPPHENDCGDRKEIMKRTRRSQREGGPVGRAGEPSFQFLVGTTWAAPFSFEFLLPLLLGHLRRGLH